jgi:hypothetical protein
MSKTSSENQQRSELVRQNFGIEVGDAIFIPQLNKGGEVIKIIDRNAFWGLSVKLDDGNDYFVPSWEIPRNKNIKNPFLK